MTVHFGDISEQNQNSERPQIFSVWNVQLSVEILMHLVFFVQVGYIKKPSKNCKK